VAFLAMKHSYHMAMCQAVGVVNATATLENRRSPRSGDAPALWRRCR